MARDKIHGAIKQALIKDGWTITHDPYHLTYEDDTVYVDLAAEQPFTAEKDHKKILVEIKSFISRSPFRDFQQALGQCTLYQSWLLFTQSEYQLYLAVSTAAHQRIFSRKSIEDVRQRFNIPLIVVDITTEEVSSWIE